VKLPLRSPRSLGARLFVSHFLVALVAAFTLLTALYFIAPVIFGRLMSGMMGGDMMQPSDMEGMMGSVGRAFGLTLLYSLLAAGAVAMVVAAVSSVFVSRRIVEPLLNMMAATRRIASGRYDERVPVGTSDELGELSESFNVMAKTLEDTEQRRLDLISDVSHEMRTPLSTIEGYMEGLIDGVVQPSEETWGLVHEEAVRLRRLVDDLQELSRAETGHLVLREEIVSPRDAARRAAERVAPLFEEKGVSLSTEAPEELPPVLADPDRLAQVLTNLLGNALRHTSGGSNVAVKIERRRGEALFRVEDAGEGIAPEHLPHVFERFYRAEQSRSREGGGAGVGLAISKALVEAMGGRIWAESAGLGKGAVFTFTLPLASDARSPKS